MESLVTEALAIVAASLAFFAVETARRWRMMPMAAADRGSKGSYSLGEAIQRSIDIELRLPREVSAGASASLPFSGLEARIDGADVDIDASWTRAA